MQANGARFKLIHDAGLWRNHEDAVAGGGGPWHDQARMAARTMYEYIDFGAHDLVVDAGAGSWRMEDYKG